MAIPLKDMNQTVDLTSKYDDERLGEKTIFKLRTLSNSQLVELVERMEKETITTAGSLKWLTDVFSFSIKEISGLDVEYEDRELGGKKIRAISLKWLDEKMPSPIIIDIAGQAMRIYKISEDDKKKSDVSQDLDDLLPS